MSIDEMRFQDDRKLEQFQHHYYEQQYYDHNQHNPYQNYVSINE